MRLFCKLLNFFRVVILEKIFIYIINDFESATIFTTAGKCARVY